MAREHYHFITGRLAAESLDQVVRDLAAAIGFDYTIDVLPITIAAMITPKWAARRLTPAPRATRLMVPGYCEGDLSLLEQASGLPVERGPKDLKALPDYFGQQGGGSEYGGYDVEILAQIKNAHRATLDEILVRAKRFDACGADVIVLCGDPRQPWADPGTTVRALREEGRRVAIESRDPAQVEAATLAGAELVFSVDRSNCQAAKHWGCEVVVVPDVPGKLTGVEETVDELQEAGVRVRVNPQISPLGFGFAESLGRYLAIRWQWPQMELLMSLGSVVENVDVDSAGVNVLLLGFCQEMGIRSVLVSQENNWSRSCVRECDLARQMLYDAARRRVLPKQIDSSLMMLRDAKLYAHELDELLALANSLRDPSPRIFAENGRLHVVAAGLYLDGTDPYELFDQILEKAHRDVSPPYAFYLGYEMAKAVTALTLGKNYRQDDALNWGMLTVRELTRRERRAMRIAKNKASDGNPPNLPSCE